MHRLKTTAPASALPGDESCEWAEPITVKTAVANPSMVDFMLLPSMCDGLVVAGLPWQNRDPKYSQVRRAPSADPQTLHQA
jgi:hypothetical protein